MLLRGFGLNLWGFFDKYWPHSVCMDLTLGTSADKGSASPEVFPKGIHWDKGDNETVITRAVTDMEEFLQGKKFYSASSLTHFLTPNTLRYTDGTFCTTCQKPLCSLQQKLFQFLLLYIIYYIFFYDQITWHLQQPTTWIRTGSSRQLEISSDQKSTQSIE